MDKLDMSHENGAFDFKKMKKLVVTGLAEITANNPGFEKRFANELGDEIGQAYGNATHLIFNPIQIKIGFIVDTWKHQMGEAATLSHVKRCLLNIDARYLAEKLDSL